MLEDGIVYGEVIFVVEGFDSVLKNTVLRSRPYLYSGDLLPAGTPRDRNDFYSFPSGHSSVAFAAATFGCSTYVRRRHPRLGEALLACAPGYALAVATAMLRVEAGVHFPTDVIAGAGIGTAAGIGIPMLHSDPRSDRTWAPMVAPTRGGAAFAIQGLF